jgi:hypothetical protein
MTVFNHLIHFADISPFLNTAPKHIGASVPFLAKVSKFRSGMNQALATATILEQPFPLPHAGTCQDETSTARALGLR